MSTKSVRQEFEDLYREHLETWGPHCGAPKSVYKGHLDKLLNAAKDLVIEGCSTVAFIHSQYPIENDYDRAYDKGRKDAAAAIKNKHEWERQMAAEKKG